MLFIGEIIDGILLGDAYLQKNPTPITQLSLSQSSNHIDYVEYVARQLDCLNKVKSRSRYDKRTKKTYYVTEFRTVNRNIEIYS